MKKILPLVILFVTTAFSYSYGQENIQTPPAQLLSLYFNIKDALVGGNPTIAAVKAEDFVKVINTIDSKIINDASRSALLKDATAISVTKNIKDQRIHFSSFSDNMIALVKTVKLSGEPVYQQYCPMKKASWLSPQAAIKNPYYGNAMLTCGKVEATLK